MEENKEIFKKLPMRDASKRWCAIRTTSVGLTMPESFERSRILIIVYMEEPKTTNTVVATVFVINGPLPLFNRSSNLTIIFLIGLAKDSVKITANSIVKSENKSCNIFVVLLEY